jgi:hypothetical protein
MPFACAILSSVASPLPQYVSTLSNKRHDFLKIGFEYKTCVLLFYTDLCETVFFIRRTERVVIKSVYWA